MILLLLIVPPLLHNYFFSDDHTRVRLRSKADEDKDDYLNANFVDGFRQPRAYIATQGPIQGTFPAFWKMVWEQNTQVIVMITHLFENGKVRILLSKLYFGWCLYLSVICISAQMRSVLARFRNRDLWRHAR